MCEKPLHPVVPPFPVLLLCLAWVFPAAYAAAAEVEPARELAQHDTDPPEQEKAPRERQLILPNTLQPREEEEGQNCMTVCAAWGEDCTYINRGIGGTTRSCRRVCQQFTEECF